MPSIAAERVYFVSEIDQYAYYLLELDGDIKLQKLDVTKFMYHNKGAAERWRDTMLQLFLPDLHAHPKAEHAIHEVERMYRHMVNNHEGGDHRG